MANLKDTFVLGKLTVTDSIIADKFKGPLEGNAATATKFNTDRTFSFAGDVSGTVTTDCASGFEVSLSVANNSHTHTYDNITNLDTPLTNYLNTAKAYTDDKIAALIDSSPDLLNTLNELAAAINDDPNFATTVADNIATKLSKTGGTMSGAITFNASTVDAIKYAGSKATYTMIKFINNTADGNGNGIMIGGGGSVYIGSGESAANLYSALSSSSGGTEAIHISGDDAIKFYSNCQTIANRKETTYDNSGNWTMPGTVTATQFTGPSKALYSSGFGNGTLTYLQTSSDFNGNSGWAHYLIANHGDGEIYYNYTIALPFWGAPKYRRKTGYAGDAPAANRATDAAAKLSEWFDFVTSENYHTILDNTYLQLTGGTMSGALHAHGGITLNSSTAQASGAPPYILGIKAFAEGGNVTWSSKENVSVGHADAATKLVNARNFTIGNTAKSFDGSANVAWTPNDIGYRYEWNASVRGVTWSRLCNMGAAVGVEGSKYILNISATRGNVVYNDTFLITAHHASNGKIIKIAGNNYTSGHQIRLLVNSNGDSYVELYDNAQSITTATYQTVRCRIIPIFTGTPTLYTSFTNGTTLPSGYSVKQTMTINTTDMQGNLSGNADTASKWATARTISINSAAGTTGTSVDGSQNASLTIPSTMTGFSSITSTNFVGNVNGTLDGIDSTGFLRYYNANGTLPSGVTLDTVNTPTYLYTVSTSGGWETSSSTKPTGIDNAFGILHIHSHVGNYATQLGFGGTTGKLYFRNAYNNASFGTWNTLLDSNNYTDYTVTKAGSGAYGTWGISITGSSGSASSATVANSLSIQDTRAEDTQPKNMRNGLSIQLKATGTGGLSDGGSFYSNLSLKQWSDYSGGPFSQLAITANQNLWFRTSSSETAWNSWKKVAIQSANNTFSKVYITSTTDMDGTAQPGLIVGSSTGAHIEMDNNEIQCFKTKDGAGNYTTDTLYFQQLGGAANFGTTSAACRITASSFSARSDRRLKENLIIFNPQKSILDLPIYKYDFINGEKEQIGCMAQDLQEICPELINIDEKGYLSIKESKIVYLLINEIKKLKNEVEVLKYGN